MMLPLLHRRILVTRSRHQASDLAARLEALGATPILIPTIEIAPPVSYAALDHAIGQLATYDWLLFTSANAVEAFHQRLPPQTVSPRLKIAVIGPATARAAEAVGLRVSLIPPQAVAESLAQSLLLELHPGARILLVRAATARDYLPETLTSAGARLTVAEAYRTIIPEDSIVSLKDLFASPATYPDAITFTSSSTAANLLALLEAGDMTLPAEVLRASIGPITSKTLRDLHLPAHIESPEATIPALVQTLEAHFLRPEDE